MFVFGENSTAAELVQAFQRLGTDVTMVVEGS